VLKFVLIGCVIVCVLSGLPRRRVLCFNDETRHNGFKALVPHCPHTASHVPGKFPIPFHAAIPYALSSRVNVPYSYSLEQIVALTGRNTTGPPCSVTAEL